MVKRADLKKFRVALYGILFNDGKVLLTETRVPSGTIVNFPGGGLELGESPIEAVRREFTEETGLTVQVKSLLYCTSGFYQNKDYLNEQLFHVYYSVEKISGSINTEGNNDDVIRLMWEEPMNLPLSRMASVDLEFVDWLKNQTPVPNA